MQQSDNYHTNGYLRIPSLFSKNELMPLLGVLIEFHNAWLEDNKTFYQQRAINSAYITSPKHLSTAQRLLVFKFIGQEKLREVIRKVLPESSMFMGTQLFFDPANSQQANYWHRDIQYNELTIAEQQEALLNTTPLHFRLALKDERGIELVPGTHRRWDTDEEFEVRTATNGRETSDALSNTQAIALQRGDLLVFSGNMIHRGLYGQDRFAFDMLFSNCHPVFAPFIQRECLPSNEMLDQIDCPEVFQNALKAMTKD